MGTNHSGLALVTGASSGIGAELARVLARHGHDLLLVARDRARLDALASELGRECGVKAEGFPADLGEAGGVGAVVAAVESRSLEIEVLVNNAGVGMHGPFASGDPGALAAMLKLNVLALTELTRALLPAMLKRKRGQILNLASTAAFFPGPYMAAYYASKAYVLSFSVALATELDDTGITVTALCPGPTRSAFAERAGLKATRLFRGRGVMEAAEVAKVGYDGMRAGEVVVIPGLRNKLLAASSRVGPRTLAARIVRALHRP